MDRGFVKKHINKIKADRALSIFRNTQKSYMGIVEVYKDVRMLREVIGAEMSRRKTPTESPSGIVGPKGGIIT